MGLVIESPPLDVNADLSVKKGVLQMQAHKRKLFRRLLGRLTLFKRCRQLKSVSDQKRTRRLAFKRRAPRRWSKFKKHIWNSLSWIKSDKLGHFWRNYEKIRVSSCLRNESIFIGVILWRGCEKVIFWEYVRVLTCKGRWRTWKCKSL